jgi:HEAT repeat protein
MGDARGVVPLVGALKDGYAAVREAGALALARIGAPAVEPLIAALKDQDGATRKGASEALIQMGAPAVGALVEALGDVQLRGIAGSMIWQINDPSAIEPLIAALCSTSDQVRKAAADTLDLLAWSPDGGAAGAAYWAAKGQWQKCVEVGAPAVESLIDALRHHDSLVRQVAARGLGQIGDARAVEPLIGALRGREDVRAVAAQALGQIDDGRAVEPLISALKDGGSNVRAAAARALGQLGDVQAVDRLIGALKDHESSVRQAATLALGEIGDARAVEPLIGALKGREDVRSATAAALGEIADPRAVEPLIAALKDWRVCVPAAEALARIGAPAAAPLVAALSDRNEVVRNAAAEALIVQIGAPAVKPLVAALGDEREAVRITAADTLDRLAWSPDGGEAGAAYWAVRGQWDKCVQIGSRAVEFLIVVMNRWQRADLRRAAAGALGIIGDVRAVEPLCVALNDGDADVREAAAQALGGIGDVGAVDALIVAMKDRAAVVRRAAAGALGRIDDPRAASALAAAAPKVEAAIPVAPAGASAGAAFEAVLPVAPAAVPVAISEAQPENVAVQPGAVPAAAASPATATAAVPAPAPASTAARHAWRPTYQVPPVGMAAWDAPDPSRPPTWQLAGNLDLMVESGAGAWARVRAVNGWWGWVDGRLLVARR